MGAEERERTLAGVDPGFAAIDAEFRRFQQWFALGAGQETPRRRRR